MLGLFDNWSTQASTKLGWICRSRSLLSPWRSSLEIGDKGGCGGRVTGGSCEGGENKPVDVRGLTHSAKGLASLGDVSVGVVEGE